MKKLILPVVAMLLCMTACKKEENGILRLEVEHYNSDAKMHIDSEDFAVWDNNDAVYLNGQATTVSISGTTATIAVPEGVSAPYYASYPYQATSANGSYTITLPAEQTYRKNEAGQQILDAPMAAYSADGNKLKFRNICSILALKVIPSSSATTKVLRIEVSANQPLWGDISFQNDLNSDPYTLSSCTNGGNTVTLMCNNETVPSTGKIFNIALPVVENATFAIKVYTQEGTFNDSYSYTRTQTGNVSFAKNTIHQVPLTLNIEERSTPLDLFTINSTGSTVSFAATNLIYSNSVWGFSTNPWSYISQNTSINNATNCDLFGFSTDSQYGTTCWSKYTGNGSLMGSDKTFVDWGNALGTNSGWYTLTSTEWLYVFNTRTNTVTFNSTSMGTLRWVRANVSGVNGVILFPDGNVTLNVSDKSLVKPGRFISATTSDNTFTADEWNNAFKPAGCVFLPAISGFRYSTDLKENYFTGNNFGNVCYYWSKTPVTSGVKSEAMAVSVINKYSASTSAIFSKQTDTVATATTMYRREGLPIRLVRTR